MGWLKGIAEWGEADVAFVSVPFTWLLPRAYERCVWLSCSHRVRTGGPAVSLMPDYLRGVAEIGGDADALPYHNPEATFTSRGCIRSCAFCAVPMTEGAFVELPDWEPRPIVCDNNLLACSRRHFDTVIDRLKPLPYVDFNQGLDARLLTDYHADRLAELRLPVARLSWDRTRDEPYLMTSIDRLNRAGISNRHIRAYVLIGFDDTPDDALYRLDVLRSLGIWPDVQRYQPLWSLKRNEYVAPNWTESDLKRFCRYWNRQRWLGGVSFEDYDQAHRNKRGVRNASKP